MQPVLAHSAYTTQRMPSRTPVYPLGQTRFAQTASQRDTVHFSRQAEPSHAEKLAKTQQEAHQLFTRYKNNPQGLLNALKQMGVEVFDGNTQPWVNDLCNDYGAQAFFHIPDSHLYPDRPFQADSDPKYGHVWDKLNKNKKLAIFMKGGPVDMGTLMHETFHILQFKNGLPFSVPSKEAHETFLNYNNNFNGNRLLYPFKWLFGLLVQIPLLTIGRALGLVRPKPNSPGESMRTQMRREKEVDQFLGTHGGDFGLSFLARLHCGPLHYAIESRYKELLSYKLG